MKRILLFLILLIAIPFIIMNCDNKSNGNITPTPIPEPEPQPQPEPEPICDPTAPIPWEKLGKTDSNPTVFTITDFEAVYLGDTISQVIPADSAYINANKCSRILDVSKMAQKRDCSESSKYADLVAEHSKIALSINEKEDKLNFKVRLQIKDHQGANSTVTELLSQEYQFYEYTTTFSINQAEEDKSKCIVTLKPTNININAWNLINIDTTTGKPKDGDFGNPTAHSGEQVTLRWNYAFNTLNIETVILKKDFIELHGNADIAFRINSNKGILNNQPLENKMLISK